MGERTEEGLLEFKKIWASRGGLGLDGRSVLDGRLAPSPKPRDKLGENLLGAPRRGMGEEVPRRRRRRNLNREKEAMGGGPSLYCRKCYWVGSGVEGDEESGGCGEGGYGAERETEGTRWGGVGRGGDTGPEGGGYFDGEALWGEGLKHVKGDEVRNDPPCP